MFSQLFFLILVMLIINLGGGGEASVGSPLTPSVNLSLLYLITLALIYLESKFFFRKGKTSHLKILVSIELLAFLALYYFFFDSERILKPFLPRPLFHTLDALIAFSLYFLGELLSFFWQEETGTFNEKAKKAFNQVRILVPFILPFLAFIFIFESLDYFEIEKWISFESIYGRVFLVTSFILLSLSFLILMPFLIQKIWLCRPLNNETLKEKLEQVCRDAHFKHGGMKIWGAITSHPTAAIVGIIPSLRYIMFTQKLLDVVPSEGIEAVLAHEIGHSQRKHLLLMPFIFLGMILFISLFLFLRAKLNILETPLFEHKIFTFLFIALMGGLYFRFIFGFFSRLFERQADLHVFELKLDPVRLSQALDLIGVYSGYNHDDPNWHHYSLRERIQFLDRAKEDPELVQKHHKKVYVFLLLYACCFFGALLFLNI